MVRQPHDTGEPKPKDVLGPAEAGNIELDPEEEELQKLAFQAMVGRITPEVVHDINNQLTGILGYAELLMMKKIDDPGIRNGLKNILLAAEKSKGLLDNLLVLAHGETSLTTLNNVNLLLGKTIELRSCALRHRQIEYSLKLDKTVPSILLDGALFHKTVLALIMKAEEMLEPFEYGKTLILETLFNPRCREVIINIRDNNTGISADHFVTLCELKGEELSADLAIRLGLIDACRWIKSLGGSIDIECLKERGTTLSIHFPAGDLTEA